VSFSAAYPRISLHGIVRKTLPVSFSAAYPRIAVIASKKAVSLATPDILDSP
jgi:hypothetical protein